MMLQKNVSNAKCKVVGFAAMLVALLFVSNTMSAQTANKKTGAKKVAKVYEVVDKMPEASVNVSEYLGKNIVYPKLAKDNKIEGRVVLSFIVDRDGSVRDIKAKNAPDEILANEAIRVVKNMPKWKPGELKGKKVAVYFTLPVLFKLA